MEGDYFIVTLDKLSAFIIKIIAVIELCIGFGTFFEVLILPAFLPSGPQKPLTVLPSWCKSIVSIVYYSIVIFLLEDNNTKRIFHKANLNEVLK